MPPISLLTPQNSYLFSLLTVRIVVIASFTSNLEMHLIKKLVSTVSSHRNLLQYLSHFACQGNFKEFHFLTLSELNDKLDSFPWMDNDKQITLLNPDAVEGDTVMYNGPPPSPALIQPPSIPPISRLVTSIIALFDRLFFISHSMGNVTLCEWRLVCIAFSIALSPSCLQDGCFLVEFYTLHHDYVCFNANN
jgi:hypothetical protein